MFYEVVYQNFLGEVENFQILVVKFIQDSVYQKLLKSVNFYLIHSQLLKLWTFLDTEAYNPV